MYNSNPVQSASVRVDLKRLALFLSGEQLQPKRAIANIVDREVRGQHLQQPLH